MADPTAPACDAVAAWLDRRGVSYKKLRIPLDKIDERESRKNQARPEALIPEVVDRYTTSIRAGDQFPPVVAYMGPNGKMVLIDGNHRTAGHRKAGVLYVEGYCLAPTTSSETIAILTVEANAKHGMPTSADWRVHQALDLVGMGVSQEEAADAAGIRKATLSTHIAATKGDQRAKRLQVRTAWGDLSVTARSKLNTIRDDAVFIAAANCAVDSKLRQDDIDKMVRDVRAAAGEGERLEVVAKIMKAKALEVAAQENLSKQGRSLTSPKLSLTTGIGKVMAFDVKRTADVFRTPFERQEMYNRCDEAMEHLLQIQDEIKRLDKEVRNAS